MGGAFQKKFGGEKWLIDWMFYMLRHKNKTLNADMSTDMTVLHG